MVRKKIIKKEILINTKKFENSPNIKIATILSRASPLPGIKVYPTEFNSPHFNCKICKLLDKFVKALSTVNTFLFTPITQTFK